MLRCREFLGLNLSKLYVKNFLEISESGQKQQRISVLACCTKTTGDKKIDPLYSVINDNAFELSQKYIKEVDNEYNRSIGRLNHKVIGSNVTCEHFLQHVNLKHKKDGKSNNKNNTNNTNNTNSKNNKNRKNNTSKNNDHEDNSTSKSKFSILSLSLKLSHMMNMQKPKQDTQNVQNTTNAQY